MGTALRKLLDECKAQKDSISGKGKLTKEKITKIQNYYGRAIKDNADDPATMKKRIFAILYHLTSTDKDPKHIHCPPGAQSWCFWQRACSKDEVPGPHKEHDSLPLEIGKKLVPIFQRLTEDKLLQRCKRNRTQNPNESLHGLIWRLCPKITFAGRRTIENATSMAICQFSMGATYRETLCRALGINPGKHLMEQNIRKSLTRIRKAEKATSRETKVHRKRLKFARITKEKEKQIKEGETYKSGEFDWKWTWTYEVGVEAIMTLNLILILHVVVIKTCKVIVLTLGLCFSKVTFPIKI